MDDDCYEDVHLDDLNEHPSCPHGPTLLFSRKTKHGIRKFYACSACRERKLCPFFHWADEKYSEERKNVWKCEQRKYVGDKTHEEMYATLSEVISAESNKQLFYCHSCSNLTLDDDVEKHLNHDMTFNLSLHQLLHPTELLKPFNCDKKEAQYLFSEASLNTLINITLKNDVKSVICIGAPRIHERIKTSPLNMRSILLDIDRRYHMFYGPDEFCWFNSFNCHFFLGQASQRMFRKFLTNDERKMLLILDPPFGARLEPLAHTIKKIENLYKELRPLKKRKLFIVLIYPYFMEKHVMTSFPTLKMIDYKVTYDNHSVFSQGRKLRSPVRIFTNINPTKIILPEEEGYKFCSICNCWVGSENNHCNICKKCTSKNGFTYVHCKKCKKCVKPSWKHCNKCKRCRLENHECSISSILKCHLCGKEGHKYNTCIHFKDNENRGPPIVNISGNSRKRKGDAYKMKTKKKKNVE